MICLRWQSKSEAGIEIWRKAAASEEHARYQIFMFIFAERTPSAWAPPASSAIPLARGPCLQFPHLLLAEALNWQLGPAPALTVFHKPPLPIWHPNWSQTLDTSSILERERGIGARCEDAGVWASLSLRSEGRNTSRKVNCEAFWEEKAANRQQGKTITYFCGLGAPVTFPGVFLWDHLFSRVRHKSLSCRWWWGLSMFSLLLHQVTKQCEFLKLGFFFFFFFSRKTFALFFLNLPQIFTADSNTKQTNQQTKINVLLAGLVVSSMTPQETGRGREMFPWYPLKQPPLGRINTHSSRKTSLFLGEQGSPVLSAACAAPSRYY